MCSASSPMVGLLIGSSAGEYAQSIIHKAHAASQQYGFRLTCFICEFLRYYTEDIKADNIILDFIGSNSLDALIIAGPVSDAVLKRIVQKNAGGEKPVPVVCLTKKSDEVHSVLVDNTIALHELMEHLLDHHAYTRLAFLGGPEGQSEAEARKSVFIHEMQKRNLEVRNDWIAHGNFHTVSGISAMKELLQSDDPSFEGVVVATDQMAIAAQKYLESIGYKVPEDLFISGFDDFLPSSLTTVRQPLQLQIQTAVELIYAKLNGQQADSCVVIPAMLKIRSSCGCSSLDLLEHLSYSIRNHKAMNAVLQQLESAFFESLGKHDPDVFLSQLREQINSDVAHITGAEWRTVFLLIEKDILAKCTDDFDMSLVDQLLDMALTVVMNAPLNAGTVERFFFEDESLMVQNLNQELNNTATLPALFDLLASALPMLGYHGCRFAHISAESDKKARLRLVYDNSGRRNLPDEGIGFSVHEPPSELFRTIEDSNLITVVRPLFFHQQLHGFISVDADSSAVSVLDAVCSYISNAIRSVRLWEDRLRSEEQMIQSEKMAALGKLVAGIAHEINTPIGIGLTTASDLRLRAGYVISYHKEGTLTRALFDDFLQIVDEETGLIEGNLVRAADLIRSFKKIAVDQSNEEYHEFYLKQYLEDIVASFKPKLKKHKHSVTISCPEALTMYGPPGTIAQVMSNLITNSIVHGFDSRREGRIDIHCSADKDKVLVQYSDNGAGMSQEVVESMFEPFFTTKMGQGGSGLGMYIVYNLLYKIWKGTIRCESKPGSATSFFMSFSADCRNT